MRFKTPGIWGACLLVALSITGGSFDAASPDSAYLAAAVEARAEIEKVYWHYRDWPESNTEPKPSFAEVMDLNQIQAAWLQVEQKRAILAERWGVEIDVASLQQELDRIAASSQQPDRLKAVFAALDYDADRIANYFALPLVVDRLFSERFQRDSTIHSQATVDPIFRGELTPQDFIDQGVETTTYAKISGLARLNHPGAHLIESDAWETFLNGYREELRSSALEAGQVSALLEKPHGYSRFVIDSVDENHITVREKFWSKTPADEWLATQASLRSAASRVGSDALSISRPLDSFELPSVEDSRAGAGCTEDTWRSPLQLQPEARFGHTAVWTGTEMIIWGGTSEDSSGSRYNPSTDTWTSTSLLNAPAPRTGHAAVWTGTEMLIWGCEIEGGRYNPSTDTWAPITLVDAPVDRCDFAAVWTGTEMFIWGGYEFDGGLYNPATDSWRSVSQVNAHGSEPYSNAVWTGTEVIVWGGGDDPYNAFSYGTRYNPSTDTWTSIPFFPQEDRIYDEATWTGTYLVVTGGLTIEYDEETEEEFEVPVFTGGRFNPATNSWASHFVSDARYFHTAVWTGNSVVVYGGEQTSWFGNIYDPVNNFWSQLPFDPILEDRVGHSAVWDGDSMIIWGGANPFSFFDSDTGFKWTESTDTWSGIAQSVSPSARSRNSAVWTGAEMIVFGGAGFNTSTYGLPGRYDPITNDWSELSSVNQPGLRINHSAVWTGTEMIVWGGAFSTTRFNDGGRYNPTTDAWVPTTLTGAPSPRNSTSHAWTGSEMLIWGGFETTNIADGARYNPATDSWTAMSTVNAPAPGNTPFVWTGTEALHFRGSGAGARYNPSTDSWAPMSSVGQPPDVGGPASVWTGTEAIYWGGSVAGGNDADTGGHYNPATDSWTLTPTTGAPGRRDRLTAVWTGEDMIIWGGRFGTTELNDGARYDPATQQWTPLSDVGTPIERFLHTAIFTGSEMLVWGGQIDSTRYTKTGAAYCASSACTPVDWYGDFDSDGVGDAGDILQACDQPAGYTSVAGDCNDGDGTVFGTPGETLSLVIDHNISTGESTVSWSEPAALGGAPGSARYDLLRSSSASDFSAATSCVLSQSVSLTTVDAVTPAPGAVQFYLSRASNACPSGNGTLGFQSDATERSGITCP